MQSSDQADTDTNFYCLPPLAEAVDKRAVLFFFFFFLRRFQSRVRNVNIGRQYDLKTFFPCFFPGQVFNEQRHSCQGQVSFEDIRGASNHWWSAFQKFYGWTFAAAATGKGQARDHSRNIVFIFTQVCSLTEYLYVSYFVAELFNIPNWECPYALRAPFYEGL